MARRSLTLPGVQLQVLGRVQVGRQDRHVPDGPGDDRQGEGCTVLALVEVVDFEQRLVPWASLREKYPLAPLDLGA